MDIPLIIIISLASLIIISAIIFYLKTPIEQKDIPLGKLGWVKAFATVLFILSITHFLAWYWDIANINALYLSIIYIISTTGIWVFLAVKKQAHTKALDNDTY